MIQCPNCKNQIPDCSQQCQFCGVQFTPPTSAGMSYQPYNQSAVNCTPSSTILSIKNYRGLSIFMSIIAVLSFGPLLFDTIVYSIMRSFDVDKLLKQGRIQEAEQASTEAKKWSMYPIRVWLVVAICFLILTIIPLLLTFLI